MSKENLQFNKVVGEVVAQVRKEKFGIARKRFAYEYEINSTSLYRIETGKQNTSFFKMWKASEALGMKFSDFAKIVEDKLGEEFTLLDR